MADEIAGVVGPRKFAAPSAFTIVALLIVAVLLFLVGNPLFQLLKESFSRPTDGSLSFANYVFAFSRPRYVQAYVNSIELGTVAALLSAAMAVPLAWGVSRTDMPGRNLVHTLVLMAFLIPPFVGAIGWILLGGPNAGWINRLWVAATGAKSGPINIFSFWGLAVVTALYSYPLIYVFAKSALDLVSTEIEEAAAILGADAGAHHLARHLAAGGCRRSSAACSSSSSRRSASIGTPALLAIPAGFNVITTQLAALLRKPGAGRGRRRVLHAAGRHHRRCCCGLQRYLLSRRSYSTIGGKGGHRTMLRLRATSRWLLLAYALFDRERCRCSCRFTSCCRRVLEIVDCGLGLEQFHAGQLPAYAVRSARPSASR